MGIYVNPGNGGFAQMLNGRYVDKTGLIALVNEVIDTEDKLICISRPRRFGKTFAAKMLCAYYDKTCDSHSLFDGLQIEDNESYKKHLNRYDVIYLDITRFISRAENVERIVSDIQECVIRELMDLYPECIHEKTKFLPDALSEIYEKTRNRFFFIIDEWDALFRETKSMEKLQESYIKLLRGIFKGGPATDNTIVGAYMTGILPIKKYGTESALTDFREYSVVEPGMFAQYVGFTEDEIIKLCERYNMDFSMMEQWYDGYTLNNIKHIYSPNSVMSAIRNNKYSNYWTKTETYESLKKYICMNMDGLKDAIITMLCGQKIEIDTLGFQNDMINLNNRDDVLTLLVHLGYLAYIDETNEVYIPNLEVSESFRLAVKESEWREIAEVLEQSRRLLRETLAGNSDYVAEALTAFRESSTSVLKYNDENSMSCALIIAYYAAQVDYTIIREYPSGKGFVDLAFIPKRFRDKPAIIVELKYNHSADTAIAQIKEKRYQGRLKEFAENLLLVGISYERSTKEYSCVIESV